MNRNGFNLSRVSALFSTVAAVMIVAPVAQADMTFSLNGSSTYSQIATISTDSGNSWLSVYTGPYLATIVNGSQTFTNAPIYCVDVTHTINYGDKYNTNVSHAVYEAAGAKAGNYYNGGLASAITSSDYHATFTATGLTADQRASEVAWLSTSYLNAITSSAFGNTASVKDNQAAVTLAIWDIIQNGGGALTTGTSFRVDTNTYNAWGSLAQSFETLAAAHSSYSAGTATFIQAPIDSNGNHAQDFVYLSTSGIGGNPAFATPEPSETVFALASLGGIIGLVVRKRRAVRA